MKYRVVVAPDEEGMFVAEVPSLPGCLSQGRTRAEAVANIREAIAASLESLRAHDEPVPPPITEEVVEVDSRAVCRDSRVGRSSRRSDRSDASSIIRAAATSRCGTSNRRTVA